jgi:hypothetical protein
MTLQELIDGFDYLSVDDAAELNDAQQAATFEIEEAPPLEPRDFDLSEYAQAIAALTAAQLDTYCETCNRPNPKRRVRRNGAS